MKIICTYCGSECGERERSNGRCGSCACFFVGNEEVVGENVPSCDTENNATTTIEPEVVSRTQPEAIVDSSSILPENSPGTFDPNVVEADAPMLGMGASEGLIQPRKLSPQYRRQVERNWQSTFGGGAVSALHTLNTTSPSTGTKQECPTLSIATRKILRSGESDKAQIEGDYELNEVIGEGSMGRVWSARQTSLDRNVAVKVPMSELAGAGSVGESQFISEVVVTGQLEHPNIVPIYELGRDAGGLPFYSMKHVQGQAWNETIADNSIQENLEILMKVCDAIAFAHDRNFLHRDIKPHNVMVGEFGEVSVMDWGIAVAIEKDPDKPWASIATGPAGTPAYMAPEMAAHNPSELGIVSDIYLLGAVLYEIVAGTPPHPRTGDTREALLAAAANEIIPTNKSGELIDIARRAMATNLSDRYQSVQEFQDAIREYRSHRESIKLSESADQHFSSAVENQSSDEFARARFAYEEALRLWDGNQSARHGLKVTTLAHAKNALDQENYELGISILDAENPSHRELLTQLEASRAQRRRLAWVSKIAAGTAVAAILSVVVITFYSYGQLKDSARQLESEKETAVQQRKIALTSAREARSAEKVARDAEKKAKSAEKAALAAKNEARGAEQTARLEKRRAEEAAYASEIGLAAESIRRNEFEKALRILEKMDPVSGASFNSVMSKQRHLEWGLLRDAAAPATMHKLLSDVHVEAVDSSVDGKTIVAGTDAGKLFVWIGGSIGEPMIIDFGVQVSAAAVSNDGRFFAAGGIRDATKSGETSQDRFAIAVWDTSSNEFAKSASILVGHDAPILSLQFARDGQRLVSSASDRKAIVWDHVRKRPVSLMRDHLEAQVYDARFSPDGQRVVTCCEDGRVRVWEIRSGNREAIKIRDLRGHDGPVYCADFTLDGDSIVSGGYDRRLLRWNLGNLEEGAASERGRLDLRLEGKQIASSMMVQIGSDDEQHEASIRALSIQRINGQACVLTGGNDNTLRIWTEGNDRWLLNKILRGHGRWVRACAFSEDGRRVISGAFDGLKQWAWRQYQMPRELFPVAERRLGKRPSELGLSSASKSIYSPDGRWVATAYKNGTVALWDLESKERSGGQLLGDGHALLTATGQFFNRGSRLLTSAGDNTSRIWDVRRGTQTQTLSGTGYRGVAAACWQPTANRALVITGSDDRLVPARLWLIEDGKPVSHYPLLHHEALEKVKLQLGGKRGEVNKMMRLASAPLSDQTFHQLRIIKRMIPDVTSVEFSNDAHRFAIGDSAGNCFIYKIGDEDALPVRVCKFLAHSAPVCDTIFEPGGKTLITASEDGQVRRWNANDATLLTEIPWSGPVTAIALSGDGRQLLIGHAPVAGREFPIAEIFSINDDNEFDRIESMRSSDPNYRDLSGTRPTVQSVQFIPRTRQALITLFFPSRSDEGKSNSGSKGTLAGYRMGTWKYSGESAGFEWIEASENGEIASAALGEDPSGKQLLVVGGKGARLWATGPDTRSRFTRLVKSFRPSASIVSIGFSLDPESRRSERLVVGDSEGNLRVWSLKGDRWSESDAAAQGLAGRHDETLVSTCFNPTNPDQLVSVDRSGHWNVWQFETDGGQWKERQSIAPSDDRLEYYGATFSPDGRHLVVGHSGGATCWTVDAEGKFFESINGWKPRPVRESIFSKDGRWLITSDGVRDVSFWDSKLQLLARLNEDDALSVCSMDLSDDRRRFVTGQGKRIVIWDTSRIGTRESDQIAKPSDLISELLTLEEHRAVASIQISPNGQSLLSAGTEGRTVIWTGKPIAPITLTSSISQVVCRQNAEPVPLDPNVEVFDPSRLVSYSGVEITASVVDDSIEAENLARDQQDELTFSFANKPAQDMFEQHVIDGITKVIYRPFTDAEGRVVGSLVSQEGDAELRLRLTDSANAEIVENLLRSIHYQARSSKSIRTEDSRSTEDVPTQQQSMTSRRATISIEGLNYRASDDTVIERRNLLYPDSIQIEFDIEIQGTGTNKEPSLEQLLESKPEDLA